jgi:hypothetical protein
VNPGGSRRASLAILRWVLALGLLFAAALPAFSQGCALCYTQAAASGSRMIQALRSGILILIIPPTLGSVGIVFILYRKRDQYNDSDSATESDNGW